MLLEYSLRAKEAVEITEGALVAIRLASCSIRRCSSDAILVDDAPRLVWNISGHRYLPALASEQKSPAYVTGQEWQGAGLCFVLSIESKPFQSYEKLVARRMCERRFIRCRFILLVRRSEHIHFALRIG